MNSECEKLFEANKRVVGKSGMNDYFGLKTSISFERFVAAAHLSTANISMHANLETKEYFARLFAV